jgi:hypothetical protein
MSVFFFAASLLNGMALSPADRVVEPVECGRCCESVECVLQEPVDALLLLNAALLRASSLNA